MANRVILNIGTISRNKTRKSSQIRCCSPQIGTIHCGSSHKSILQTDCPCFTVIAPLFPSRTLPLAGSRPSLRPDTMPTVLDVSWRWKALTWAYPTPTRTGTLKIASACLWLMGYCLLRPVLAKAPRIHVTQTRVSTSGEFNLCHLWRLHVLHVYSDGVHARL